MSTEEQSKFEQKIARQLVAMQYPQGKRTNGEMNEDAHLMRQNQYFKNIIKLIEARILEERREEDYYIWNTLVNKGGLLIHEAPFLGLIDDRIAELKRGLDTNHE